MVNTSNAYKEALQNSRIFHHKVEITFGDGRTATAQDLMELYSFKILDSTSNTNSFDLGSAIAKQLNIRLDNTDGQYNDYDFSEAESSAKVGLELADGTTEWIDKGIYISEPGEDTGASITLKAYDNMIKFDRPYSLSKLAYPATLLQIVQDACSCCGVLLAPDSATFDNSRFVVDNRPDDGALTFRQVLQYVCQIACRYACITAEGKLSLRWYDTDLLESTWQKDGKTIISGNDNLIDVDTSGIVQVEDLLNGSSITTDDVVITGIKVTEDGESGNDETSYLSGTDDYVLEITGNKLIQGTGEAVASFLGERLNGLRFRPVSVSCQGNPAVEAGDIGLIKDAKGRYYKTIFTETTYNAYAAQSLVCGAEAPVRKSSQRYSEATKVYQKLRAQLAYQKTEVEKAFEDLGKQMDSVQGLHPIQEKQEDGSYILYLCDKPTLAESKIVIKMNAQGWGMSTDGGETWNVGALVDGTTIAKILYAIGVNADWINAGLLDGERINARGLKVTDDNGKITLEIDEKGNVIASLYSLALGDKSITDIATTNLLRNSEFSATDLKRWWYSAKGTIERGKSDPFGGNDAIEITGLPVSSSYNNGIALQSYSKNKSSVNCRYYVSVWLKSSAVTSCRLQLGPLSTAAAQKTTTITSQWKEYTFIVDSTWTSLLFNIRYISNAVGSLFVYKPQITLGYSDEDIFNMLTANGAKNGIYMSGGQLYFNGAYLKALSVVSAAIAAGAVTADKVSISELAALSATIAGFMISNGKISKFSSNYVAGKAGKGIELISDEAAIKLYGMIGSIILTSGEIYSHEGTDRLRLYANAITKSDGFTSDERVNRLGSTFFTGNAAVNGDLRVYGTKSIVSETKNYGEQNFYCYETPTPVLGDFGGGTIGDDGISIVSVDDIFRESTEMEIEYYVFLQIEGGGQAWVSEKTDTYFIVRGTPGLHYAWELKAKQKNKEYVRFSAGKEDRKIDFQIINLENAMFEEREKIISDMEGELL